MSEQKNKDSSREFDSLFITKKISKGTILLRQGEKAHHSYQVLSGCLRSYVIDSKGKKHIIQFAPENWLISDMNSFLNNTPAVIHIDFIEDREVILYDKRIMDYIEKASNSILLGETKRFQNNVIAHHKRIISLLMATGEERYTSFMETYPSLSLRLPLKLIASYLGITLEHLSRIRKKMIPYFSKTQTIKHITQPLFQRSFSR